MSALLDALQMGLVVFWALLTGAVKMQHAATQWEHLTIQLDTQIDRPASQTESQSATKGHEMLRMHLYVKQANGPTASRGPWKPHGHNHRES